MAASLSFPCSLPLTVHTSTPFHDSTCKCQSVISTFKQKKSSATVLSSTIIIYTQQHLAPYYCYYFCLERLAEIDFTLLLLLYPPPLLPSQCLGHTHEGNLSLPLYVSLLRLSLIPRKFLCSGAFWAAPPFTPSLCSRLSTCLSL